MNHAGKTLAFVLTTLIAAQTVRSQEPTQDPKARLEAGAASSSAFPNETQEPRISRAPEPVEPPSRGLPVRGFESPLTLPGHLDRVDPTPPAPSQRHSPYVVNGLKANPEQFPWMALLTRKDDPDVECSAALISAKWVLTADHCLKVIKAGALVHFWTGPPITVKRTVAHKGEDDIGLIELETAAPHATISIGPAPAIETEVTIIGFGKDESGSAGELNYAFARVVSSDYCSGIEMTDAMLCVGDERSVVCAGDSGGPLLDGGRLVGIANKIDHTFLCGPALAGRLRVGAFARAESYTAWIDSITAGT